jgi:hypothetical protein
MHRDTHRSGASKVLVISIIGAVVVVLLLCVGSALVLRGIGGPMVDALNESRIAASEMKSQVITKQVALARSIAHDEFEDRAITIAFLLEQNYISQELLQSSFGPVSDGRGDYWLHPSPPELGPDRSPARCVIAYDRAMYQNHASVSFASADGGGGLLERAQFDALLAEPENQGVDHDLPARP